ncbi:MAG: hypothetical protein WDM80_05955 [Limisphaerales bacterium]
MQKKTETLKVCIASELAVLISVFSFQIFSFSLNCPRLPPANEIFSAIRDKQQTHHPIEIHSQHIKPAGDYPSPATPPSPNARDPLPSWNDGAAKQAIVNFVKETTQTGGANFVPPEERIATFDQDGTLWVEHPVYSQLMFCFYRVGALVKEKTGVEKCRAVQDGHLRRPRGHRETLDA